MEAEYGQAKDRRLCVESSERLCGHATDSNEEVQQTLSPVSQRIRLASVPMRTPRTDHAQQEDERESQVSTEEESLEFVQEVHERGRK